MNMNQDATVAIPVGCTLFVLAALAMGIFLAIVIGLPALVINWIF